MSHRTTLHATISLLVMTAIACLAVTAPGIASVVPVDVSGFGPATTIETFEDIAGVEIPADPFFLAFADVPIPFDFGNGVSLTLSNVAPDGVASILDRSLATGFGWGLGIDGGEIQDDTVIPSGTAILTHSTGTPNGEIAPLEFTFDQPVARVGAFMEASNLGLLSLEAFDVDGISLGLVDTFSDGAGRLIFDPDIDLGPLDTWLGLETADGQPLISSVVILGDYMVMDDLHFEVPEPASLSLFAVVGLLALRRRR